jgi:hypothetical protein
MLKKMWIFSFIFSLLCLAGAFVLAKSQGFDGDNLGRFLAEKYFQSPEFSVDVMEETKWPVGEVQSILIEAVNQDVKIRVEDREDILIRLTGKLRKNSTPSARALIRTEPSGPNALKISIDPEALKGRVEMGASGHSNWHLNIAGLPFGEKGDLEVVLPKKISELQVNSIRGDIDLGGDYREVSLRSVSGDLLFQGNRVEQLYFDTVSGDLKGEAEILQAESHSLSGDVDLRLRGRSPSFSVETASGDVSLKFLAEAPDVKISLASLHGDLEVRGKDQDEGSSFQSQWGQGTGQVRVNSVSGDIEIR